MCGKFAEHEHFNEQFLYTFLNTLYGEAEHSEYFGTMHTRADACVHLPLSLFFYVHIYTVIYVYPCKCSECSFSPRKVFIQVFSKCSVSVQDYIEIHIEFVFFVQCFMSQGVLNT